MVQIDKEARRTRQVVVFSVVGILILSVLYLEAPVSERGGYLFALLIPVTSLVYSLLKLWNLDQEKVAWKGQERQQAPLSPTQFLSRAGSPYRRLRLADRQPRNLSCPPDIRFTP